jgi:hypothetical protein
VCQKITGFCLVERYPFITESGLTQDDVDNALMQVTPLLDKVRAELAEL